ncbi:hypothetical protein Hypma_014641 [Hypsizygus marmoreus]|uniref:Uncharacterized protein n=1 Tax=Hypsizygus marmoreus TaxID=39966 RepID=A0A369JA39_HYPMA|nr:hypothetical protein Hypma_014641 [Hypsizygus marmoreus]
MASTLLTTSSQVMSGMTRTTAFALLHLEDDGLHPPHSHVSNEEDNASTLLIHLEDDGLHPPHSHVSNDEDNGLHTPHLSPMMKRTALTCLTTVLSSRQDDEDDKTYLNTSRCIEVVFSKCWVEERHTVIQ